jgi:death on curing protein
MRYLALAEVVELHQRLLTQTGGASGVRDLGLLAQWPARHIKTTA